MKKSLLAIAKILTPVIFVAGSLVAVQVPAYAATATPLFLSFEDSDALRLGSNIGANGAFEGATTEVKTSSNLSGKSLHFTKNGQPWSGANLLLSTSTPYRYTDATNPVITLDYWSNDSVPSPVMLKLESPGSVVKTLEAQPGLNRLSFDMSTGTGWNPNAEYKILAIFPNFGADDRSYTGVAKIANAGQIYEIDNVSINGGTAANVAGATSAGSNGEQQVGNGSQLENWGLINQVSSGQSHACAIDLNKKVVCWGENTYGQTTVPADLGSVSQVTVGGYFSCALKVDGTVKCWGGYSRWKQDYLQDISEIQVPAINERVTAISSGFWNSCAIGLSGALYCWGGNQYGESPVGVSGIKQVDVGFLSTCAVTTLETVRCWGNNDSGQTNVPSNLGSVKQVSTGVFSCAVTTSGEVRCWGRNWFDVLAVPSDLGFVTQVSVGERNACALNSQGNVRCWGDTGTLINSVPADVSSVEEISTGVWINCAMSDIGKVWCWGDGYNQAQEALSVPTFAPRNIPAPTSYPSTLVNFEANDSSGYSLKNISGSRYEVVSQVPFGGSIGSNAALKVQSAAGCVGRTQFLDIGERASLIGGGIVEANIYSPIGGKPITMRLEDINGEYVESSALSADEWWAYKFEFSGAENIDYRFASIIFDFDCDETATYYLDDVAFNGASRALIDLEAPSADTNAEIRINGALVQNGGSVSVQYGTPYVPVQVTTASPMATYFVTGEDSLETGANLITVDVRAADELTIETYTFTVYVENNSDTSAKFYIDFNPVNPGEVYTHLDPRISDVTVDVEPTDTDATWNVVGGEDLAFGINEIYVTVTAADGTTQTYTLLVENLNNLALEYLEFTLEDGTIMSYTEGFDELTVSAPEGAKEIEVYALAQDPDASVSISGNNGLTPGVNNILVTVTSANNVSSYTYKIKVSVSLSNETGLSVFRVNDIDVENGSVLSLLALTREVDVYLETIDPLANWNITGDTNLVPGLNTLTVSVTAQNGTVQTYTVNLRVELNDDASLAVLSVGGVDVVDGEVIDLAPRTRSVDVSALATDDSASVSIFGSNGLVAGANEMVVLVTAADGFTTQRYTVVLFVPLSNDTSISKFLINGTPVSEGAVLDLGSSVSEVDYLIETTDAEASYSVTGFDNLVEGENFLTVNVTAADGTIDTVTVTLNVEYGRSLSLTSFTINDLEVSVGSKLEVEAGTTDVTVNATPFNAESTYEVFGNTDLQPGFNTVSVKVTSADGAKSATYNVAVFVQRGFEIYVKQGSQETLVKDDETLLLPNGTRSADVVVKYNGSEIEDALVGGHLNLATGENQVSVMATSVDGKDFVSTFLLFVEYSTDTSVRSIKINGVTTTDGSTLELPYGTPSVDVVLDLTNVKATYEYSGDSGLLPGINPIVITVVAEDGFTTRDLYVFLNVAENSDSSVETIRINGFDVIDGDTFEVESDKQSVDVSVVPVDPQATFQVSGNTGLGKGSNELVVTVTAADGISTSTYTFTVVVLPSSDTSLAAFEVDGVTVLDGGSLLLEPLTKEVDVYTETNDSDASVEILGDTGLEVGENPLVVRVLAADGVASREYTVVLVVPFNTDASATVYVDGNEIVEGDKLTYAWGTESVEIDVEVNDPDATFVIEGDTDLVTGENTITVVVTAADSLTTIEYTVLIEVLKNTDTSLATFMVNGEDVENGSIITLEPLTDDVDVLVETTDLEAEYIIEGDTALEVGLNELVVTVTAANGDTIQEYVVTLIVEPNTDASLAAFLIAGLDATDVDELEFPHATESVDIEVLTNDPVATFEVFGGTDLQTGDNEVRLVVTAADGITTEEYVVNVKVALNDDVSLEAFEIEGEAVSDGQVITLAPLVKSVDVYVATTDSDANFELTGGTGLEVGENRVVVSVVAADGVATKEYVVVLVVPYNTDASATVSVDGLEVFDGQTLTYDWGVGSVEVEVDVNDPDATYIVQGDSDLATGENLLSIVVTAADSKTTMEFNILVIVLKNTDTSLALFTVDGETVEDGSELLMPVGTTDVSLLLETTDPDASYEIEGGSNLGLRENQVVVTVTAANGYTMKEYRITLFVPPSTDSSISGIFVNGQAWEEGKYIEIEAGDIDLQVETNNEFATFKVSGVLEEASGIQDLEVVVTAQDGIEQSVFIVTVWSSEDIGLVPVSPGDDALRVGSPIRVLTDLEAKNPFYRASYTWLRDGVEIDGATLKTYTPTAEDLGTEIRVLLTLSRKGTMTKTHLSKAFEIELGLIKNAPATSVKGTPVVGRTLEVVQRTWPRGVSLKYQWFRDGVAIPGQTAQSYRIAPQDADRQLSLAVTGSMLGYESLDRLSPDYTVLPGVFKFTVRPRIQGTGTVGTAVTVNPGVWPEFAQVKLVWMRNGAAFRTSSVSENTYTLASEDFQKRFSVQVVAEATGYRASVFTLTQVVKAGNWSGASTVKITGKAEQGQTVVADHLNYPFGTSVRYFWYRDGVNIRAVTGSTYEISDRDVGRAITVKITVSVPGYRIFSETSQRVVATRQ